MQTISQLIGTKIYLFLIGKFGATTKFLSWQGRRTAENSYPLWVQLDALLYIQISNNRHVLICTSKDNKSIYLYKIVDNYIQTILHFIVANVRTCASTCYAHTIHIYADMCFYISADTIERKKHTHVERKRDFFLQF